MTRFILAPLTALALAGCNTEKAYWDLINEHGVTWDTTAEGSMESGSGTGGTAPTTSSGDGDSHGASAATEATDGTPGATTGFDTSTSNVAELDLPPTLEFSVTPEDVKSAMFVDLAATCEDGVGVVEVRFFIGDALLAALAAPPFEAKWPVKSTDEDGPRTVRAECEDTAGYVVSDEKVVGVTLPQSGSEAWTVLLPSKNWSTEALDASAAPDGSWWVCGYDSAGGGGGASMWVAHFAPDGTILFNELISRGPDFHGTCSGIEAFPGDPHRAALTGTWVKDSMSPLLWTGVVDETRDPFVIAKNEDNYLGEVANDVTMTADHEVRITGYRLTGKNSILTYRAFTFKEGQTHLAHLAADEYDSDVDGGLDAGEAIVALPDGRSLIAGRAVHKQLKMSRGIVALVGANHQIVKDDDKGWPLIMTLTQDESEGYGDITVTPDGLVAVAGWRQLVNPPGPLRPRLVHFDLTDPATAAAYTQLDPGLDFAGRSLARLSTGPVMVAATKRDPVEKDDIWIEQYNATGWGVDLEDEVWPKTFTGFYQGNDAPHAIRVNALDKILVVGYETIQTKKDGQAVTVRQAWVRAFEG